MTKLFECYVAHPSEDEAVEIVERLIANGAKAHDVVEGMGVDSTGGEFTHNDGVCWGYHSDCGTYLGNGGGCWASHSKQLTMQEFRAAFPCEKYDGVNAGLQVGEIMELVEDTDFFSAQTGESTTLKSGHKVVIAGVATRYDNNATCAVVQSTTNTSCGFCVLNPDFLRPIKSDREKFIEAAIEAVGGKQAVISADSIFGKLYDAGFKAPEVK